MARKRAAKSGKRVRDLEVRRVSTRATMDVKSGRESTIHPAKVTTPDIR